MLTYQIAYHLTKLLEIALKEIGVREYKGKDNPRILHYFHVMGLDVSKFSDETAWCSAFVNYCAITAGLECSGKLTARSWLKIGKEVKAPIMGDIVVFWRESPKSWKGHVGIFIRETENYIYCLGGNQSNRVKISAYPKYRLLGYRRLNKV